MKNSKTVLITGATSGIGLDLARIFAVNEYNMVLVSRDEAHLKLVAEELWAMGAQKISIVPKDLTIPGSAEDICLFTRRENIRVDILINDAGLGEYGYFIDTDLQKELAIIQLNIASLVHLTKIYLPEMVKRNEGKILQLASIASIASYQPTPMLAVYAATKAFVLSFTDALIDELKDTKVTLTALIPGATDTDFFNKAGMENTKAAQNPQDSAVVAQIGYDALMKGQAHAYAPGIRQQIIMSTVMSNERVASMAHKQMEEK